jgi:hypothetical protein
MKSNFNKITATQWVKKLRKNDDLFKLFIEDCENYERKVSNYYKTKGEVEEKTVIVGKQFHIYNLERRFFFFEHLMYLSGEDMELGDDNIKRLCNLYIDNPGCELDTQTFLNSFSNIDNSKMSNFVFGRRETKVFFDILCRSRLKLIALGVPYYKCFSTYFRLMNLTLNSLAIAENKVLVLDFDRLVEVNQVWECVRYSKEKETLDLFIKLLISLYTNLSPNHSSGKQIEVKREFIDKCLRTITELKIDQEEQAVTNLVKSLEVMLDSDDGKKYETENEEGHKQIISIIMKPSISYSLNLDGPVKKIEVDTKATIGQVRKKISNIFQLPFNSFEMFTKEKTFGEKDYDIILRIYGYPDRIFIQKIPIPLETPKSYLAQSQTSINTLFMLLAKENTSYVDSVWKLLNNIPESKEMKDEIQSMEFLDQVLIQLTLP